MGERCQDQGLEFFFFCCGEGGVIFLADVRTEWDLKISLVLVSIIPEFIILRLTFQIK